MLFDEFVSRIIVKGKIILLKPLHIGVGDDSLDPIEVDSPVLKNSNREPVIPGSSLKGVLRSRLESILRNTAFREKWSSCNVLSDEESCVEKEYKSIKTIYKDNPRKMAEKIYEKSCDVCRLFGNKHLSSKIQIKDMNIIGQTDFERRDGVGIDRDSGTAYTGAKYNFEVVPAGSRFDFYMTAENLDNDQKKLFNLILQLLKNGDISIGGQTSRGLGQIRLVDENITEINRDNIAKYYGME